MGISSQDSTTASDRAEVVVTDETTGVYQAVETIGGKGRALVDANISSVNVPLGQDPIPDTFFTITNAGAVSDTIRVQVAATAVDSSAPDRDLPAVDVTTTVTASEVGDEVALADLVVADLNADTNFNNALLKAEKITGAKRAIVYITSTRFSLTGEFHERPLAGDVAVSVTGTTTILIDSDREKLISRPKQVSLARDPSNPHKTGLQGISGTVAVNPGPISNRFEIELLNTASPFDGDMTVDGSSAAVTFEFPAIAGFDQFVTAIIIHGIDNGIKLQNFLGQNAALTNGLIWDVRSDDETFAFPTIKSTRQVKRFATAGGWEPDFEASADDALAIKDLALTPIVVRKTGLFTTDDFIKITVNDDLTNVLDLRIIVIGFKREA